MDKLKESKKKITKEDVWGVTLVLFVILNIVFFFWNVSTNHNVVLNYIATTMCSFALGLWLRRS